MESIVSCDGGMVKGGLAFQKVHEVDVPLAGGLDLAGAPDAVHVRVDDNG